MFRRIRRPDHVTLVAYLALFVALGGVSYAAVTLPMNSIGEKQLKKDSVGSAEIKSGAVGAAELKKGAVGSGQMRDGSVDAEKLTRSLHDQLQAVARQSAAPGASGQKGDPGAKGEKGVRGADGSPDSAQQVLGKLKSIQGSGSGMDADRLDGTESGAFGRVLTAYRVVDAGPPVSLVTVPGYGQLLGDCISEASWTTEWAQTISAPTSVTSGSSTQVFAAGAPASTSSSGPADRELWQTSTAGGLGMTLSVMAQGVNGAPDQCRFSLFALYDVP
jgi:hypothetical protein